LQQSADVEDRKKFRADAIAAYEQFAQARIDMGRTVDAGVAVDR